MSKMRLSTCATALLSTAMVGWVVWSGLASGQVTNPDGIAVIIGNRNYEKAEDVDFAHRDAAAFKRYVVELLGFDPMRIVNLRDAGLTQMYGAFGNPTSHKGQVWRRLKPNRRSDVVVYYSGHGVPGLNDKKGYLMPVDAEPDLAELMGYSLDVLHKNLGKLEARSVTVYVDACFSGDSEAGMLFRNASPVRTEARLPTVGDGKVTLLTAASGRQLASWDREARQGLFTNHLLDGLYGAADANQDGRVTAGEAKEYLDDHMTSAARVAGREQTATLRGRADTVLSVARFPTRSQRKVNGSEDELKAAQEKADAATKEAQAARQELAALDEERQQLAAKIAEQQADLERLRERRTPETTPQSVEDALGLKSADYKAIQRGLLSMGKRLGGVDGVFEDRTRGAILEWQAARNLPATGYLTRKQAEALIAVAWEAERVGREFRDCGECPEMVVVPSGEYTMGSSVGEKGRFSEEGPRHRVRIGKAFAVGKYEVTFGEWDACVAGGGCRGYRPDDGGWGRGRRPVIRVSWEDAKGYVEWLSVRTGKGYRLLSEAEWEYVARAGTYGPFHTGSTIGADQANYNGNFTYGSGSEGAYRKRTIPVGSFLANGFGLHDVHGNVWEWVEDCWHGTYEGAPTDGSAWVSGGYCRRRVLRGGSWYDYPRLLRSASRSSRFATYRGDSDDRGDKVGFRIARTLTP